MNRCGKKSLKRTHLVASISLLFVEDKELHFPNAVLRDAGQLNLDNKGRIKIDSQSRGAISKPGIGVFNSKI